MNLIERFKNLKIHPYMYVEPCPNCSSNVTGRYVKEPLTKEDMQYVELQSLKHGEIVRFINQIPEKNAFCVDCDFRWHTRPKTIYLSKLEMEEMIEIKQTEAAYVELRREINDEKNSNPKGRRGLF